MSGLNRRRLFKRYAVAEHCMTDELNRMKHPIVIQPADYAEFRPEKMGKATLFESPRLLVGLNGFEPGQSHALHTHAGMDKMYQVISGSGVFLLDGRELPMTAGDVLIAPEGIPHGVKNTGSGRLLLLAVLAPAP
jgi:quercetin dioxygenase-like cupin family protein